MKLKYLITLAVCGFSAVASAQSFPDKSRPLKIVVPFGAGSGNDLIARAYARSISETAGIPTIVENRPGAESVIGVDYVKTAPPDGYTILFGNSSTHILNGLMLEKISYDPIADFIPVRGVASSSLVLNAGPSTKFRNLKELLEVARANPGKLTYGSATTSTRLAMEMFEQLAKVKLLSVPYKAMTQATAALAGGEIDLLATDVATVVPYYQSGRLRPIGATGAKRLFSLPELPTIREQGISQYEFTAWSAMFVPARTPSSVVEKLGTIFQQAHQSKFVTEILNVNSQEQLDTNSGQVTGLIRSETDRWIKILSDLKTQR